MLTQCRLALRKSPVTGGQHEKGKINKQEYKKKTMFVRKEPTTKKKVTRDMTMKKNPSDRY